MQWVLLEPLPYFSVQKFRFVDDFNGINRIITTGYFLWTLLAISSTLLSVQMQLVRRFWRKFSRIFVNIHHSMVFSDRFFFSFSKVRTYFRIWAHQHINPRILLICIDFTVLLFWWNGHASIQCIQWCTLHVRLVYISTWIATHADYIHDHYGESNHDFRIW